MGIQDARDHHERPYGLNNLSDRVLVLTELHHCEQSLSSGKRHFAKFVQATCVTVSPTAAMTFRNVFQRVHVGSHHSNTSRTPSRYARSACSERPDEIHAVGRRVARLL